MNRPIYLKLYYRERKERTNEEYFAIFELFLDLQVLLDDTATVEPSVELISAELYDKDFLPYTATTYKPDEK